MTAYRTASKRFTDMIRNKRRYYDEIQEVLVPTEENKTSVCIIMKNGVFVFEPSKEYHRTKKYLQQQRCRRRLSREAHIDQCNRLINRMLETYRQEGKDRLRRGISRKLTKQEEELLHERANDKRPV